MTLLKKTLALLPVLFVLACSLGPVERPPLTFTKYRPIHLAVSSIEIVDQYKSPLTAPYVEQSIPYSPSDAMHIWVKDRLRAVGSNRIMQVIIKDASVVASPQEASGLLGLSPVQQTRYDAKLDVEMRIYNEGQSMSAAALEVNASRTIYISDVATTGMRDSDFRGMMSDMMNEVNAELEKDIFAYMGAYISYQNP